MCVIIVKPEGVSVNPHDLERAWNVNHHGAGVLIPGNPPIVVKGLMKLRDLKQLLEEVASKHCIIHLRMATHGSICANNTHPFRVSDRRWLMHNGVLTEYGSHGEKGQSDSGHLATDLGPLTNSAIRRILNTIPGKYAFVDRSSVSIHGHFSEHNDCEWSNLYWLPAKKVVHTSRHELTELKNIPERFSSRLFTPTEREHHCLFPLEFSHEGDIDISCDVQARVDKLLERSKVEEEEDY